MVIWKWRTLYYWAVWSLIHRWHLKPWLIFGYCKDKGTGQQCRKVELEVEDHTWSSRVTLSDQNRRLLLFLMFRLIANRLNILALLQEFSDRHWQNKSKDLQLRMTVTTLGKANSKNDVKAIGLWAGGTYSHTRNGSNSYIRHKPWLE